MKRIKVDNLSSDATEAQVQGLFTSYGVVKSVTLINDRDAGGSGSYAFVEMDDDTAADAAVAALNGMMIGGRALDVSA
jgi:RNA recognition motif-containing protein